MLHDPLSRTLQLKAEQHNYRHICSNYSACKCRTFRESKMTVSLYLLTISAGITAVRVDSCPWRHGEQHFHSAMSGAESTAKAVS